jgi:hypothetical protein
MGGQIRPLPGGKIIQYPNSMSAVQKLVDYMGSNKSGTTGDQYVVHVNPI